ncbi:MAG: NUMOD3 domain-containing DNA-binding protein, partial [Candidatus Pacearchaeota archaeon]|nr:NUMOD3 domain-containing DNA-binding protein [Candidatus Pacearchaeota archaeon]
MKKGEKMSEEQKRKISLSEKGKRLSEEHKEKLIKSHLGKHLSKEAKEKVSKFQLGRPKSKETREKISKGLKGRIPWSKGKKLPHSEETILRIKKSVEKYKGISHSEEQNRKISEGLKRAYSEGRVKSNKGKKLSEEKRLKMSLARTGKKKKKLSEEQRKKMSERLKKAYSEGTMKAWNKGKHIWTNTGRTQFKKGNHPKTEFKKGQTPWNKGKNGIMPTPWNKGKDYSEEQKIKIGKAVRKAYSRLTEEEKEKRRLSHLGQKGWNKGKHLSKEQVERQRATLKRTLLSNPEIIKKISETKKQMYISGKIKAWNKGKKTGVVPWNKGTKGLVIISEETRKKIGLKSIGRKPTEETRKKLKEARAKQVLPFRDTKIEVKIQNFLDKLNIQFIPHRYIKEIKHAYQCDILIPSMNLIIECDGDTYHFNPKRYKETDKIFKTGKTAKEKWELDKIRTQELIEQGFKVLRLWESEINKMNINAFKE